MVEDDDVAAWLLDELLGTAIDWLLDEVIVLIPEELG